MISPNKNAYLFNGQREKLDASTMKSEIIIYNNKTEGEVDTNAKHLVWTAKQEDGLFFRFLNMGRINAQFFLEELGKQLVANHLKRRIAETTGINRPLQFKMKNFAERFNLLPGVYQPIDDTIEKELPCSDSVSCSTSNISTNQP